MITEHFIPLSWATNPHLQTILPKLIRRKPDFEPAWQRLELPDGDFVDLAWSEQPIDAATKPRLVLFHGLEGNFYSPYIHGLMSSAKKSGWLSVVMHLRGCSGEPNRNNRIYHSGETSDMSYLLQWLQLQYGQVVTCAAGFSLGGNILACYLAQQADKALLDAAIIVSAPFMLEPCSIKMEQGISRIYHNYLLRALKQNAIRKLKQYPNTLPLTNKQIQSLKTIRQFDDLITAPIHQFKDASDYYQRCSALPLLVSIKKPLLIIHAKDDPMMTSAVIPSQEQLSDNITYQLTKNGGHVGFVSGHWYKPKMWLEHRILHWLSPYKEKLL